MTRSQERMSYLAATAAARSIPEETLGCGTERIGASSRAHRRRPHVVSRACHSMWIPKPRFSSEARPPMALLATPSYGTAVPSLGQFSYRQLSPIPEQLPDQPTIQRVKRSCCSEEQGFPHSLTAIPGPPTTCFRVQH